MKRLLSLVACLLVVAACTAQKDPPLQVTNGDQATVKTTGTTTKASTGTTARSASTVKPDSFTATGHDIVIKDYAFTPAELTVKAGTNVTWTNLETDPPVEHWVKTVPGQPGTLDSGKMAPDASYNTPLSQPGEFSYYCEIHNVMKGKITVTP